jgi:hypothetical protein
MLASINRRSNPRTKFFCFAHFQQLDAGTAGPERLCVTRDFSHDGVYFFPPDNHALREGMQLLLKFPYDDHSPVNDRRYLVEVIRISSLPRGHCGVGARLFLSIPLRLRDGLFVPETGLSKHTPLGAVLQRIDLYA